MDKPDALSDDAVWDPEGSAYLDFSDSTSAGDWVWCVACRKASKAGWYVPRGGKQMCPFGRGGDAVLDPMSYRLDEEPECGDTVM